MKHLHTIFAITALAIATGLIAQPLTNTEINESIQSTAKIGNGPIKVFNTKANSHFLECQAYDNNKNTGKGYGLQVAAGKWAFKQVPKGYTYMCKCYYMGAVQKKMYYGGFAYLQTSKEKNIPNMQTECSKGLPRG